MIIQDAQIANFYLQEFAARYYEAGGNDSILVTDIEDQIELPVSYSLSQNYPNPFNPINISFSIPQRVNVELVIYNTLGEKVSTLINEVKDAGSYRIAFNGSNLPSGLYFYRFSTGEFNQTKKLILLK